MKYFKDNISTLEQLRKQYKDLLKKYHPDNANGSTEATQDINNEYDRLFTLLKKEHDSKTKNSTDKEKASYSNMKWDITEDEKLREMLSKIIHFKGITIEIVGNWIWCFDSYGYRKELKELGFKYANNKKAWYYHTEAFRKKSNKKLSMNDIRNYYGSTEVQPEEFKRLKQA